MGWFRWLCRLKKKYKYLYTVLMDAKAGLLFSMRMFENNVL
jgi:hypothetical protein